MNTVAMLADKRRAKGKQPSASEMLKALDETRARLVELEKREIESQEGSKELTPPPLVLKTAKPPTKTQEDLLIEAARASLRQYGTLIPPPEALYAVMSHKCPRCGHEGPITTDFGFRKLGNGDLKYQSWCRWCRGSKAAHPSRNGLPVKSR